MLHIDVTKSPGKVGFKMSARKYSQTRFRLRFEWKSDYFPIPYYVIFILRSTFPILPIHFCTGKLRGSSNIMLIISGWTFCIQ